MSQTVEFNLSQVLNNPLDFTNILFVSKGGNDTTALAAGKYDFNKQWLNPTVAMANASIGDTVIVYAGTYTVGVGGDVTDNGSQYMVKNGVTLYMMDGAFINYTNQTGTFSLPFFDGGVASTFIIRGNGKFKFNRNISGGDTFQCTTNISSTLDWEFDELDIRRRFGTTGHNAAYWRMKGRKWLNRESMLFAFRFPAIGTTLRKVYIEVEEVEILSENANNAWTRAELRNFNGASEANIYFKIVKFPHGFFNGAFLQKTLISSDSEINVNINSIVKTGRNDVSDYIIYHAANFAKGNISVKNIDTLSGVVYNTSAGGTAFVNRTESYQGRVRDGYIGGAAPYLIAIFNQLTNLKIELDLIVDSLSTVYQGIDTNSSPNTAITGKVVWHNTTNSPIRINSATGTCGSLENLILSQIPVGVPSVFNMNNVNLNLKVINVFATTSISLANGGITQLIQSININSNI
jgi:hypothetical protein